VKTCRSVSNPSLAALGAKDNAWIMLPYSLQCEVALVERGGRLGRLPEQAIMVVHEIQLLDHCGGNINNFIA